MASAAASVCQLPSVYRDEYYNSRSADKGVGEIIVAKNRYGVVANVRLVFVGERILFEDIAHK